MHVMRVNHYGDNFKRGVVKHESGGNSRPNVAMILPFHLYARRLMTATTALSLMWVSPLFSYCIRLTSGKIIAHCVKVKFCHQCVAQQSMSCSTDISIENNRLTSQFCANNARTKCSSDKNRADKEIKVGSNHSIARKKRTRFIKANSVYCLAPSKITNRCFGRRLVVVGERWFGR